MKFLSKTNGKKFPKMDFSEVHISFSTNRAKQIIQEKSKHHVSLNELSASVSAS